jgi:hypothetical protein
VRNKILIVSGFQNGLKNVPHLSNSLRPRKKTSVTEQDSALNNLGNKEATAVLAASRGQGVMGRDQPSQVGLCLANEPFIIHEPGQ